MPFPHANPDAPPRPLPVRPVTVTYEFNRQPPVTVRMSIPARSQHQAIVKAIRAAKKRPEFKNLQPSSVLVLAFKE